MGIYSEYLDRQLTFEQLAAERKRQLKRISEIRERDVLAFASNLQSKQPVAINYTDLLPFQDQIANLSGKAIDVILETPGGSGETVEDIVKLLRSKYESLGVIVPGVAKSAGTIFAMGANEILMEEASAVGPIDAQMQYQNKIFSAHALLEGMKKIKDEVTQTGVLNKAYIPILQNISPGELQHAENAYDFARDLVADWLVRYKFKDWTTHSSTGKPVTEDERKALAQKIAEELRDHGKWKTHGRSIKIDDLRKMGLKITDYSEDPALGDAIRRYYTLLQMTFASNVFKIFETPQSQIMRLEAIQQIAIPMQGLPGLPGMPGLPMPGLPGPQRIAVPFPMQQVQAAEIGVACGKCGNSVKVHAPFAKGVPVPPDAVPFPADNKVKCPSCGNELELADARRQLEAQARKPIITGDGDVNAAV